MMDLPKQVTITEVSPRDGLQNESVFVPTDIKIEFIQLLTQAGFPIIEATSFVNPKKIPALADGDAVMKAFPSNASTIYSALVPNKQGLDNAMCANCKHVAVITTISETFAQKNMHCHIEESLQRVSEILTTAQKNNISVRAYISCAMGCP